MELSDSQIAELKRQHGDLIGVTAPNGTDIVFRRPTEKQWNEFQDKVIRERDSKSALLKKMVLECAVHPARDSVAQLLETFPAFSGPCSAELSKFAGQVEDLDVKKL